MRSDFEKQVLAAQYNVYLWQKASNEIMKKLTDGEQVTQQQIDNIGAQLKQSKEVYDMWMYAKYLLDLKPAWLRKRLDKKLQKKAREYNKELLKKDE